MGGFLAKLPNSPVPPLDQSKQLSVPHYGLPAGAELVDLVDRLPEAHIGVHCGGAQGEVGAEHAGHDAWDMIPSAVKIHVSCTCTVMPVSQAAMTISCA